jgi:hypothetical protein
MDAGAGSFDKSLLDYLLNQSIGVVAAGAMFWLYVKERRRMERRLVDLLRERKTDRDEQLRMYGRIDAYLSHVIRELADPSNPKRRASDRQLLGAAAAELQQQAPSS